MEISVTKVRKKESDKQDIEYWKNKTPQEKLDILQLLREEYYEFKNEDRKGLQRVYRIVKRG